MPKTETTRNKDLKSANILGQNLKYLRLKNGFTLEDMQLKIGLKSKSAYRAYEVALAFPPAEVLLLISEMFDVSIDSLIKQKLFEGEVSWSESIERRLRYIENHLML